ncbi:hypothetical protein TWF694_007364 [Orbilia ellipsospora]|uniref:Fucose-specific lectin n=1 Tax=Orbilia ellipsospora TaxID=2528407 RepID=A0AAV9XK61_9PEZI
MEIPSFPVFNVLARFERYMLTFILGFIEGGDFLGVVSIKVLDRSKVSQVARELKKGMNTMNTENELTLSDIPANGSFGSASASKDTETSISVNWMGGGEIKRPDQGWDLDSLYAAAANFPWKVAECPQRTWAILTKYKQNRSYVEWSKKQQVLRSPLDYDNVISYTGELFDSYMEYKVLLRKLRDIIKNRKKYEECKNPNAIPVDVLSLVAVRSALHDEMSKIVKAVDTLSKDPASLYRYAHRMNQKKHQFIQKILDQAIPDASGHPPNTVDSPEYWNPNAKIQSAPVSASVIKGSPAQQPLSAPEISKRTAGENFTENIVPKLEETVTGTPETKVDGAPEESVATQDKTIEPNQSLETKKDVDKEQENDKDDEKNNTQSRVKNDLASSSTKTTSKSSDQSASSTGASSKLNQQRALVPVSANTMTTPSVASAQTGSGSPLEYNYNFSQLVAPEIWEELMPVLKAQEVKENSDSTVTAVSDYPPPPKEEFSPSAEFGKNAKRDAEEIPESAAGDRALLWGTAIAAYGIREEKGLFTQDKNGTLLHTICQGEWASWGTSVVGCLKPAKVGTSLATIAVQPKDKRLFYVTAENKLRMLVSNGRSWYDANVNFDDTAHKDTKLVAWVTHESIIVAYESSASKLSFWVIKDDVGATIAPSLIGDGKGTQYPAVLSGTSFATFWHKGERHFLYQNTYSTMVLLKVTPTTASIVENAHFLTKIHFSTTKPLVFTAGNWKDSVGRWSENLPNQKFEGILFIVHDHGENLNRMYIDGAISLQEESGTIDSGIFRREYPSTGLSCAFDQWVGNRFYKQNAKGQIDKEYAQFIDYGGKRTFSSAWQGQAVGVEQTNQSDVYAACTKIPVVAKLDPDVLAISDPLALWHQIGDQYHQVVFFVGSDFQLYYTYNKNDTTKWIPGGGKYYNLGPVKLSAGRLAGYKNLNTGIINITATGQNGSLYHIALKGPFQTWASASWTEIEGSWSTPPDTVCHDNGDITGVITGMDWNMYFIKFDGTAWMKPVLQDKLPAKIKCAPWIRALRNEIWVTCVDGNVYKSTGFDAEKRLYTGFQLERSNINNAIYPGVVTNDVVPNKTAVILINADGKAEVINLMKENDSYITLGAYDIKFAQILGTTNGKIEIIWLRSFGRYEYIVYDEKWSGDGGKFIEGPLPAGMRVSNLGYSNEGTRELFFLGINGKIMRQKIENRTLSGTVAIVG